jgi:hypothetical protein
MRIVTPVRHGAHAYETPVNKSGLLHHEAASDLF